MKYQGFLQWQMSLADSVFYEHSFQIPAAALCLVFIIVRAQSFKLNVYGKDCRWLVGAISFTNLIWSTPCSWLLAPLLHYCYAFPLFAHVRITSEFTLSHFSQFFHNHVAIRFLKIKKWGADTQNQSSKLQKGWKERIIHGEKIGPGQFDQLSANSFAKHSQWLAVIDVCCKICLGNPFRGERLPPIRVSSKKFTSTCLFLHIYSRCSFRCLQIRGTLVPAQVKIKRKRNILLKCLPACESRVRAASWTFLRSSLWLFFFFFSFSHCWRQLDAVCMCMCVLVFRRFFEIAVAMKWWKTNAATRFYDRDNWNLL